MKVLDFFLQNPNISITARELSEELKLPLPDVNQQISTLLSEGKIIPTPSGGYISIDTTTLSKIKQKIRVLSSIFSQYIPTPSHSFVKKLLKSKEMWTAFVKEVAPLLTFIVSTSQVDPLTRPFRVSVNRITRLFGSSTLTRSYAFDLMSKVVKELAFRYAENPSFFESASITEFSQVLLDVIENSKFDKSVLKDIEDHRDLILNSVPRFSGYALVRSIHLPLENEQLLNEIVEYLVGEFSVPGVIVITPKDVVQKLLEFVPEKIKRNITDNMKSAVRDFITKNMSKINEVLFNALIKKNILYVYEKMPLTPSTTELLKTFIETAFKDRSLLSSLQKVVESKSVRSLLYKFIFTSDISQISGAFFPGKVEDLTIQNKTFEFCVFSKEFFTRCKFINCSFNECYAFSDFNMFNDPLSLFYSCSFDNCTMQIMSRESLRFPLKPGDTIPEGLTIKYLGEITFSKGQLIKSFLSKFGEKTIFYRIPLVKVDTDDQNKVTKVRQLRDAIYLLLKERSILKIKKTSSTVSDSNIIQDVLYIIEHKTFPESYIENRSLIDGLFRTINSNRKIFEDQVLSTSLAQENNIKTIGDLFTLISTIRKSLPKIKEFTVSKVQEFVEKYKYVDPLKVPKEEILAFIKPDPNQTPLTLYEVIRTQYPKVLNEFNLLDLLSQIDISLRGISVKEGISVYNTGGIVAVFDRQQLRPRQDFTPHKGDFYVALYQDPSVVPSYFSAPYFFVSRFSGSHIRDAIAYLSVIECNATVKTQTAKRTKSEPLRVWYVVESQSDVYQKLPIVAMGHTSEYFANMGKFTRDFRKISKKKRFRDLPLLAGHLTGEINVLPTAKGVYLSPNEVNALKEGKEVQVNAGTKKNPNYIKIRPSDLQFEPINPIFTYTRFFRHTYSQWPQVLLSTLISLGKKVGIDQIWIPAHYPVFPNSFLRIFDRRVPVLDKHLLKNYIEISKVEQLRKLTDRSKYYEEVAEFFQKNPRVFLLPKQFQNIFIHQPEEGFLYSVLVPTYAIDLKEKT